MKKMDSSTNVSFPFPEQMNENDKQLDISVEEISEEKKNENDLRNKIKKVAGEIQELKLVVEKLVSIVSEINEDANRINLLEEELKKVKHESTKNFYSFKKDFVEYKIQQSRAASQQLNRDIEREVEAVPWGIRFEQEFLKNVSTLIKTIDDAADFVVLLDWMKSKQSPQQKEINYGIKNYTTSFVTEVNSSEEKFSSTP